MVEKLLPLALILCVGLFVLYPVLRLVQTAFLADGRYSLNNYRNLSGSLTLLWNSVFSSAFSAVLSTVLALVVALRVALSGPRLKAFLTGALLLTMVSPPFVGALAYIQLYGRRGWITYGLLGLSLNPYNWRGVVLMQTLSHASLSAIFLSGMLDRADKRLPQAARDLGASPARAFFDALLPLIAPGVWACLLLSFIRGLADFGTPIVIGGRFGTIASEVYMQITGYASLSSAAVLNTLIFLPSLALFLLYRRLMKRSDAMLGGSGGHDTDMGSALSLGGRIRSLVDFSSVFFFIILFLQYICIFAGGFVKATQGRYSFTIEHLKALLTYNFSAMIRSVQYALIVGVAGTLFAILFSYYVERRKIAGRDAWDFVATMPVAIPGACFGIGYILAFNTLPLKLTGTAAIVLLNMLFRQLPVTTKICGASLAQIPYALEDAARDLGASRLRVIRDVILPNLKSAFFAGFSYNFTSAMTTAGAVLFLIQPSRKVAVFRLFDAVNSGDYGVASLLSSFIILVTVLVNLTVRRLTSGHGEEEKRVVLAAEQPM